MNIVDTTQTTIDANVKPFLAEKEWPAESLL
jgi:hypothetical protein